MSLSHGRRFILLIMEKGAVEVFFRIFFMGKGYIEEEKIQLFFGEN